MHTHGVAIVDIRWVVRELTYLPNLYYCTTNGGTIVRFRFSEMVPQRESYCDTNYLSVQEKRNEIGHEKFDEM